MYILSQSCKYAGFRGFSRDEDMRAGGPVSTQPHVTDDDEGDINPCSEDEEFFQGRPDAEDMDGRGNNQAFGHALEYRYFFVLSTYSRQTMYEHKCCGMYTVHTQYILCIYCTCRVHTYTVHTRAFLYLLRTSGTLPTFDIEGRTFDILILQYRRCNQGYRKMTTRYRVRYDNSISKVSTFDIKSDKRRYRRL